MTVKRFTDIEHDFENARIKCKDDGLFMLYAIYEDDDGLPTLGDLLNDLHEENTRLKEENKQLNLEFARSQTEVLNKIHENIDEVTLVVQLNDKQSEVFKEIVGKDEANDLIERLKIANEIIQMKEDNTWLTLDNTRKALIILCILNFICCLWWLIKCTQ